MEYLAGNRNISTKPPQLPRSVLLNHLCSSCHGNEDEEVYEWDEAHLVAYLLQSQMVRSPRVYSTWKGNNKRLELLNNTLNLVMGKLCFI